MRKGTKMTGPCITACVAWMVATPLFSSPPEAEPSKAISPAQASLATAAQKNQHLFLLFWKQNDAATQAMRQALVTALTKRNGQAMWTAVQADDPAEKLLVDRFGLSRAPMPFALAIAPNGAVTGGFPLKVTDKDIAGAFATSGAAACLKAVQSRKLVLLCIQAPGQAGLPVGVQQFKNDAQYGPATEIVKVRSDDAAEAPFLKTLKIKPGAGPVTVLLAPPGNLVGTFEGAVSKEQLVEKLKNAQSGCCPGGKCGPGGCCPGGTCPPK